MQLTCPRSSAYLIPLVGILLLGATLQFEGLGRMTQMLNYDEAYYSVNALSLAGQIDYYEAWHLNVE